MEKDVTLNKIYKYNYPSSWYVTIHNRSLANRDTITIPVCEEEYKIISRKYVIEPQNEITEKCAISGPYILLCLVHDYFFGIKYQENIIETIKMFAWLDCTEAIKSFDYDDDIISKNILLCAIKHVNNELFYWIIEKMPSSSLDDFCEKNINKILDILKLSGKVIVIEKINNKIKLTRLFTLIQKRRERFEMLDCLLSLLTCNV